MFIQLALLTAALLCSLYPIALAAGSSFLTDSTGAVLQRADRTSESVLVTDVDLTQGRRLRHSWGVFRDRRPELYGPLLTKDGNTAMPGAAVR
jgi:predicted amidohydrolase